MMRKFAQFLRGSVRVEVTGAAPERLLNRSLFYTAVTRARQLLVLVGSEATVEKMVLSDKKTRRYSALRRRIRQRCGDD